MPGGWDEQDIGIVPEGVQVLKFHVGRYPYLLELREFYEAYVVYRLGVKNHERDFLIIESFCGGSDKERLPAPGGA